MIKDKEKRVSKLKAASYLIVLSLVFAAGKYTYFAWTNGWSVYMATLCFFVGWVVLISVIVDKYSDDY